MSITRNHLDSFFKKVYTDGSVNLLPTSPASKYLKGCGCIIDVTKRHLKDKAGYNIDCEHGEGGVSYVQVTKQREELKHELTYTRNLERIEQIEKYFGV